MVVVAQSDIFDAGSRRRGITTNRSVKATLTERRRKTGINVICDMEQRNDITMQGWLTNRASYQVKLGCLERENVVVSLLVV